MDRYAFALEGHDVKTAGRIVDQRETALRRDGRHAVGGMNVAMGGGEDKARRTEPERLHLRGDRLAVIDNVMRAEFLHPRNRLGP